MGGPPSAARDAATVMLLRRAGQGDRAGGIGRRVGGAGLEVYMLRRRQSMPFAPGAYVFPGGSVDPRDADADVAWAGPDVTEWASWLGSTPELARGLLCAAVRETFEEAGVLLAGTESARPERRRAAGFAGPERHPGAGSLPAADGLEQDRLALLDRSLSLAGLLARRGLVLRSDQLKPWARWITPAVETRRYDTRFFAAALPERQQTREIRDEADEVAWLRPADVLAAAGRGEVVLLPPTAVTLAELAACDSVAAALAAPRQIRPLQPEIQLDGDRVWLQMPGGTEYPL
jgi:8-oxo-dGTP pyrophosphatase MutT (NUDIX family)